MFIDFEKWHGCHNDFMVLWHADDSLVFQSLVRAAPRLCCRDGGGIGADGLIVLHIQSSRDHEPFKVSIINSDGSRALTCGNGIRCAVMSILKKQRELSDTDVFDTMELKLDSHAVACRTLGPGQQLIAVDMGIAVLNAAMPENELLRTEIVSILDGLGRQSLARDLHLCAMPNPHVVFFVDVLDTKMIRDLGPALQAVRGGDGINVHLAAAKIMSAKTQGRIANVLGAPVDELYEVLVWERGAGETKACGSGACAVGAAAIEAGMAANGAWIGIEMPGGLLYVKQDAVGAPITLAGPAIMTFTGRFEL